MTRRLWLLAVAMLPACATAPAGPATVAPAGTSLTYAVTTPTTVTYTFHDSSSFHIQGGATIGDIQATIGTQGVVEAAFEMSGTDITATLRVTDFAGSMHNSAMGGGPTATEADIQGSAILSVTPRGLTTVTALPKLNANVQQVGVSTAFFRRFFVRLPGRVVQRGQTWIDTVTVTEDGDTKVHVVDVVTSTFAGDTISNGRTVALINTTSQRTVSVSGTNQGVAVEQKLTGTSSGRTLWDAQRNVLVERTESSQLTGTFALPQMGVSGVPVTARGNGRVTIR